MTLFILLLLHFVNDRLISLKNIADMTVDENYF